MAKKKQSVPEYGTVTRKGTLYYRTRKMCIRDRWEMYVEIKVADTGKGISESNQAAIFRRFYREERCV